MPTEKEIEAAARALCKANGNCFDDRTMKDLCLDPKVDCRDWREFKENAMEALKAAENVRAQTEG